ncbi:hypothetical protein [Planktotalea sp.]|uniref:hypothetical protein n=1 Tax=Planktotalea sp. TaxID=2029877 RepID=UPI0025D1EB68|nr:hypothetical protein [Planktotalea sp.]
MSKATKFIAIFALSASIAGCVSQPSQQTQGVAGGAVLGAAATAIAGGNQAQIIAGGIVGATAGAIIAQ